MSEESSLLKFLGFATNDLKFRYGDSSKFQPPQNEWDPLSITMQGLLWVGVVS